MSMYSRLLNVLRSPLAHFCFVSLCAHFSIESPGMCI
jgi:hypothetical protein